MVGPRAAGRSTDALVALAGNVAGGRNILRFLRIQPESGGMRNENGPNRIGCGPGRMETARQGWRAVGTVRDVGWALGWLDSDGEGAPMAVAERLDIGADFE